MARWGGVGGFAFCLCWEPEEGFSFPSLGEEWSLGVFRVGGTEMPRFSGWGVEG